MRDITIPTTIATTSIMIIIIIIITITRKITLVSNINVTVASGSSRVRGMVDRMMNVTLVIFVAEEWFLGIGYLLWIAFVSYPIDGYHYDKD